MERCLATPLDELPRDHSDRTRNGNRGERSEDSRELCADQDRDEHPERRQVDGTSVDDREKDVVLELLPARFRRSRG